MSLRPVFNFLFLRYFVWALTNEGMIAELTNKTKEAETTDDQEIIKESKGSETETTDL